MKNKKEVRVKNNQIIGDKIYENLFNLKISTPYSILLILRNIHTE